MTVATLVTVMIVVTYLTGLTVMRMIKILSLGIPFQKIEPLVRATVGEKVTVAIEVVHTP